MKPFFHLSDCEVAQVVDELEPILRGGVIGKVYDRERHVLIFEVGRNRLLLSLHPQSNRLHLESKRIPAHDPPSALAMLLRKRLGGLRLASISVLAHGERIVVLRFAASEDKLVVELTGPHGNAFLVGPDGKVVTSLRSSGSSNRQLAPGHAYLPPEPAPASAPWRGLRRFGEGPSVASRVQAHFEEAEVRSAEDALRQRATRFLQGEIERLRRRKNALLGDLARVDESVIYKKYGDLLLANLQELPGRGARLVTIEDIFEDGSPLTIPLDPALGPTENARRYYKQHKRFSSARRLIEDRLATAISSLTVRESELERLSSMELEAIASLLPSAKQSDAKRPARDTGERLPFREYLSLEGVRILVGRSAVDNDALTFRIARGNDMWFHVRDVSGPHVVVPLPRGKPIAESTLLDAATLAAHFSPLGNEAQVDVSYTYVKNLRKPRGTAAGLVFVSDVRTIRIRLEPPRLERLLSRRSPA
ncbi:MAG: NFACT family protein [Deltaproteobacteria bacterium]|nr:NFACT family protein [Deltaproteobacteria bacterium]